MTKPDFKRLEEHKKAIVGRRINNLRWCATNDGQGGVRIEPQICLSDGTIVSFTAIGEDADLLVQVHRKAF